MSSDGAFNARLAAKKLLREGRSGALATLAPGSGDPYCSLVNVATAIDGAPVAGHQGPGTAADTLVRRLLMLQGLSRPRKIISAMSYPGAATTVTSSQSSGTIRVVFAAPRSALARIAGLSSSVLSPTQWSRLIARLGEIPDPAVSSKPSSAAIPVAPAGVKEPGGNH